MLPSDLLCMLKGRIVLSKIRTLKYKHLGDPVRACLLQERCIITDALTVAHFTEPHTEEGMPTHDHYPTIDPDRLQYRGHQEGQLNTVPLMTLKDLIRERDALPDSLIAGRHCAVDNPFLMERSKDGTNLLNDRIGVSILILDKGTCPCHPHEES